MAATDKIKLTQKEFKFADAVLRGVPHHIAVTEAGYNCKTQQAMSVQANRLLNNVNVSSYIALEREKREIERRKNIEIDDLWITEQFKEVYNRCMQRIAVMRFDRETRTLVQETTEDGEGVWTFDSAGANRALENLAKHIGYFELDNRQRQTVIQVNIQRNNYYNDSNAPQQGVIENE
jgi:phage terminase small subunit